TRHSASRHQAGKHSVGCKRRTTLERFWSGTIGRTRKYGHGITGGNGDSQLHGAGTSGRKQRGRQQGNRCLRTRRGSLRAGHWSSTFCRGDYLRNDPPATGFGATATASVEP